MNKKISVSLLKNVAMILMFINHFFCVYLEKFPCENMMVDDIQTIITRGSFLIYCFLLSEGMMHTKNRRKYISRLLGVALISEVIYDYTFYDKFFYFRDQSVMFDLSMCAFMICVYDYFKDNKTLQIISLLILTIIDVELSFNYSVIAIAWIMTFYIYKGNVKKSLPVLIPLLFLAPVLCLTLDYLKYGVNPDWTFVFKYSFFEFCSIVVLPLIYMYDGSKGKALPKWFYYGFYPIHLIVIKILVEYIIKSPLF